MERIEEFVIDGKNFVYIDFSGIITNDELSEMVEAVISVIEKYPPDNSLYTITNIDNTRFDAEARKIMADYMIHNSAYIKHGAVIGLDGIKKIMATSTFKMSGRTNMQFAFSKEQAIELLLKQD
ncbi:MAG: hypothetical protein LBQ86_04105 [Holophagales bacterium]|jgi:hypothetical protein|nr:hypothetical protein [Holophagales bacterium]